MSVEPSIINAKGDMSVNWRNWYAEQNGVTLEKARYIQIDRFFKMPEPSLKLADGKRNPMWVLWWKITQRVSTNIALKQWGAKVDGTFVKDKRRTNGVNAHLRKLDRMKGNMAIARHYPGRPYFLVKGEKIELDKRLGQGEVSIPTLVNTKLGRKALANAMAKNPMNEFPIMDALESVVPFKVFLADQGECSYNRAVNVFGYTGTEERWEQIKRNYALKLQIIYGLNYLINYNNILFGTEHAYQDLGSAY